ncbi:MAG: hypothetical protein JETCAE03_33990 [Ignavibacteriaceae bacterium]|nr:MAG: hypothetical protein JETCAE03_33990 [Ignavibacteriaceae bacterium]
MKFIQSIKWFFSEIMKMYSAQPSFFSKKRVESGIAFIIAQWGMIFFLIKSYPTMTVGEIVLWATTEFAVAGYIIKQIQNEKKTNDHNGKENGDDIKMPPMPEEKT